MLAQEPSRDIGFLRPDLPVAVNGVHPALRIGMSVTADIAIGKGKPYEYFLDTLLKYKDESLSEP